jgi:hypothetical protein
MIKSIGEGGGIPPIGPQDLRVFYEIYLNTYMYTYFGGYPFLSMKKFCLGFGVSETRV